jgi:hypothetical protein
MKLIFLEEVTFSDASKRNTIKFSCNDIWELYPYNKSLSNPRRFAVTLKSKKYHMQQTAHLQKNTFRDLIKKRKVAILK